MLRREKHPGFVAEINYKRNMNTSPYDLDLREKVVNFLFKGGKQLDAARIFNLHRNTINNWWRRYQKEGIFSARKRPGVKRKLSLEELVLFVKSNENCSLATIAQHFHVTQSCAPTILFN